MLTIDPEQRMEWKVVFSHPLFKESIDWSPQPSMMHQKELRNSVLEFNQYRQIAREQQ